MEIPILFITDMVQSLLSNLKKKTRRTRGLEKFNLNPDAFTNSNKQTHVCRFWDESKENDPNPLEIYYILNSVDGHENKIKCPFGKPGDVLWVRETWAKRATPDGEWNPKWGYCYKADNDPLYENKRWKPSIHMPKAACRIWLKITNIRIERLQDIAEEDAIAEGVLRRYNPAVNAFSKPFSTYFDYQNRCFPSFGKITAKDSFKSLWRSINGANSWDANPWVWVIEFERIDK